MAGSIKIKIVPPANGYFFSNGKPPASIEKILKAKYNEAIIKGFKGTFIEWAASTKR